MVRETFSTFDIVKCLGIPRERLKDWQNNMFIKPTIKARGKGTKAEFTRLDVYALALFKHLVEELHLKREEASKFTEGWKRNISKSMAVEDIEDSDWNEKVTTKLFSKELFFVVVRGKPFFTEFSGSSKEQRIRKITEQIEAITRNHIWNDILVVNFMEIKDKVDKALQDL